MLSLKLYKTIQPCCPTDTQTADKEDSELAAVETAKDSCDAAVATAAASSAQSEASPPDETEEGGRDPFEGLDDITKTCFEVRHQTFHRFGAHHQKRIVRCPLGSRTFSSGVCDFAFQNS